VCKATDGSDSIAEVCESHVPETLVWLGEQDPKITDPELVRPQVLGGRKGVTPWTPPIP
jgi:hypothetical protein